MDPATAEQQVPCCTDKRNESLPQQLHQGAPHLWHSTLINFNIFQRCIALKTTKQHLCHKSGVGVNIESELLQPVQLRQTVVQMPQTLIIEKA